MNTSEVLDLTKENIQPLKQGRNAAKLGTALQAQTNVELHQKLMAEREQFELLIRMYDGDDPLKPHYDYVGWIEQSFPKHGPESNLVQILENTLTTFKDDPRYKQDLRYAELLIKYIDTQPNPLQIYQLVYDQGLCTMCAPFYKAWADELDKINDIKAADQIYELGIRVKALPLDLLPEARLRFQLSIGRRMLGHQEDPTEDEPEYNRQALHKLQKKNIYSERDPAGAPGRIKQQGLSNHNNQNSAPFKIYQGDDKGFNNCGDGHGKVFPKHGLVNKENSLKAGPWTQHGGKHRSKITPSQSGPMFQVHEDEDAELGNGHHKTPSVPRALKPRKIDNFSCPLAIFEPPDPTKKPMYCKNKVYAGGREFQFEELRAAIYNRHFEELLAARRRQEVEKRVENESPVFEASNEKCVTPIGNDNVLIDNKEENNTTPSQPAEPVAQESSLFRGHMHSPLQQFNRIQSVTNYHGYRRLNEGKILNKKSIKKVKKRSKKEKDLFKFVEGKPLDCNEPNEKLEGRKEPPLEESPIEQLGFENKHIESNTSVFNCQSFTVNTKEAMNVVQEMWQSPTPSPAFGKNLRVGRPCPVSPVAVDESGVFKVPIAPAPHVHVPHSAKKNVPSFPIFADDDGPIPQKAQPSPVPFQVFTDDGEIERPKNLTELPESENAVVKENEKAGLSLPIPLIGQLPAPLQYKNSQPATDAATLKMLAFQSDSEDEADILPKTSLRDIADNMQSQNPSLVSNAPKILATAPASEFECRKSLAPGFIPATVYDEEKFEDMTCNTKAFDFALPSSTPLLGHFQSKTNQNMKNCVNGSYIAPEETKKCGTKQELSMIFEVSKERYSSSSGSSGSKTQGSVCTVANTSIPPVQPEVLEKLAQISANKSVDDLDKSLGLLHISGPIDPFSTELISQLLTHIGYPKKHHLIGLQKFDTEAPALHTNSTVKLGDTKYSVIGELGKGAYARVLKATRDGQPVALKQQRPAWEWEWYIVQELQSRLPPNMMDGYLHMGSGYIYKNASILESEWAQYGSILSVVNKLKIAGKGHDLHLAMLFSIQLISIIEHLHLCKIIHGDVKPDNFVLFTLPHVDSKELCLKLIDFGRSIDMTLFSEDTTFTKVVVTDGFQCNEMKDGREWTYQTDLYGLAGSIYCVLFYDYMKVTKKENKWQLCNKIPRYMLPAVWAEIFSALLNVESCKNQPNLTALREILEKHYNAMDPSTVNQSINKLVNVLHNK